MPGIPEEAISELKQLRHNLKGIYINLYTLPVTGDYSYTPALERTGHRGRPRFSITAEQLQCLKREFINWTDIAHDLGVSRQTIFNCRKELGFLLEFEGFSLISDNDLDRNVSEEIWLFPRTGESNLPYSVPHPIFLWHIDTNMKMIHWRICIHGCTDGFSRCIIYLKANVNNRATTVLESFQKATTVWGHPSRVRADAGGERT